MKFEDLNVNPKIVSALKEMQITEPTLIQEKVIPLIKSGKDVIGMSKTGSGKTAAFGIPLIENIKPGKGLQAIVLAPTRELAVQISGEMSKFSKGLGITAATVYGGVAIGPQIDNMARADIVVATPGRMCDHLRRGNVDLSGIRCFVLDEADKMVEMGFIEDVESILECTQNGRQILLFGATLSEEIGHIRDTFMNSPAVAEAEKQVKEDLLEQYYYNVESRNKFSLLVHLLKKEETGKTIIFCSARSTVELLTRNLKAQKIKAEMIHGKISQNRRLRVIQAFDKGKCDILVASAVAARGIDIKDVTHVFNYDLSRDPQEYIHRVGRTARAGESGKAITLLCDRDFEVFDALLSRFDVSITELPEEDFQKLRFDARRNEGRGRGRGFGRGGFRGQGRGHGREGGRGGWNDRPRRGRRNGHNTGGNSGGRRPMWKVEKADSAA